MRARDAATAALDTTVEGIATDAAAAAELFAVVDLLDGQPMLRRSLSDPSATDAARTALAGRLLSTKVSKKTLSVTSAVVKAPWTSGNALVNGLERQGIRALLRSAKAGGSLDLVERELASLVDAVNGSPDLTTTLHNPAFPLEAKRDLVSRLLSGKAAPVTQQLASRAVRARKRNFQVTVESYLEMIAELAGHVVARVTVARPLDAQQTARLKAALVAQVGRPVSLRERVDAAVIGGISVTIDDDMYESTVAARLEDARRQLINL